MMTETKMEQLLRDIRGYVDMSWVEIPFNYRHKTLDAIDAGREALALLKLARGYVQERVNLANTPGDVTKLLVQIDALFARVEEK